MISGRGAARVPLRRDRHLAERAIIYVTKANENAPAFAIRADNDDSVFIHHAAAEAAQLEVGDELIAVLKINDQPDKARWFAVGFRPVDDDTGD